MKIIIRVAAAAATAIAFAGAAQAQDTARDIGPYVVGTGDNASVVYPTPSQNIVGGAITRTTGSGESAQTEVVSVEHAQQGRPVLRVTNSGDNVEVIYGDAAPALRLAERATRG